MVATAPQAQGLTKRQTLERRLSGLKTNRRKFETLWPELEEQFPTGAHVNDDTSPDGRSLSGRQAAVFDSTAQLALNRAVAGIMSNTTSPARPWFANTLDDQEALEDHDVQTYLDEVTAIQRRVLQKSNAYRVLPAVYRDLMVFGTHASIALPDFNNVIHLHPLPVGTYWLGQDDKGKVNTCYREFWLTTEQVYGRWPDTCSRPVRDAYQQGNLDGWHKIVHAIEPRRRRNVTSPMAVDMPWASVYYEASTQHGNKEGILEEGGFRHFPVLAPRWRREGEDVYGVSACIDALPFVRTLQLIALSEGKCIAKEVEPALQVPIELKNDDVSTEPNAVTYYSQTSANGGIRRMVEPSDPSWIRASIGDVRQQVQQALFLDLFQMLALAGVDTKMTATEVAQRVEEKMLMLGPVMQNLHDELLVPLLDLIYAYLQEGDALPPPPESLQGRDFQPQFLSVLYQAQKAVSVNATERFLMMVGGLAQAKADPAVWDGIDTDWVLRESARNLGVPAKSLIAQEEVDNIRMARAKMQAEQANAAAMAQAATTAKDLSAAPIGQGTALDAIAQFTGYTEQSA